MGNSYADTLAAYSALVSTPEAQMLLSQEEPFAPVNGYMTDGSPIYQAAVQPPLKQPPTASAWPISPLPATVLCEKHYDALRQPVDNFICEGLTLLVGQSKIGKSWLVLDLCMSVAAGTPFLGKKTTMGTVLYLALEDSQRRLQSRIRKIGKPVPDNLHLSTSAAMLDTGLIDQLEAWMIEHPDTVLIVIDTFQKVRGVPSGRTNAYQQDYQTMGGIKAFADKHRISVMLVHHTNKMRAVEDVYDKISGSNGLMGAADTTILIERDRETDEATVHITGRDVWGDDFVMHLHDGRWTIIGEDAFAFAQKKAYEAQPIVRLFRNIMEDNPSGIRLTYAELLNESLKRLHTYAAVDAKDVNRKLKEIGPQLIKYDKIAVEAGVRVKDGKGVRISRHTPGFTVKCEQTGVFCTNST